MGCTFENAISCTPGMHRSLNSGQKYLAVFCCKMELSTSVIYQVKLAEDHNFKTSNRRIVCRLCDCFHSNESRACVFRENL